MYFERLGSKFKSKQLKINDALLSVFWSKSTFSFKLYAMISDSGANFKSALQRFNTVQQFPCAAHRLNLCVSDLFKIKTIKKRIINGNESEYSIFDFNEKGDLRKTIIDDEAIIRIEALDSSKAFINSILAK